MAEANYVTAGSSAGVQVLSQTQVAPVQSVRIYTQPHGTYVVVQVPLSAWRAGHAVKYLKPVAAIIENLWEAGFISGAQFVQDVDPSSGLLTDFVDFTVSYTPGSGLAIPFTSVVRVPVPGLSSETAFTTSSAGKSYGEQIAETYAQLAATAGR